MDEADRAQEYIERTLADALQRALQQQAPRDWPGCYCGEKEEDEGRGLFCGTWCRDLYEKETKLRPKTPPVDPHA
jgi:hypothetical protein